jgi:hypothetical protein
MKINQIIINETTTAGAVATVAKPMGEMQTRTKVRGLAPVDKVMKGKAKKQGPYANSLSESKNKVEEAKLDEEDLIVIPGKGIKRKTGFIPHGQSRVDHEVEMARSDVLATMKNAKSIYHMLKDRSEEEGIEGWVQEKLIKANDYLNSVKEYYDEKMMREMNGGVIAAGGVGEGVTESYLPDESEMKIVYRAKAPNGDQWEVKEYQRDYLTFLNGEHISTYHHMPGMLYGAKDRAIEVVRRMIKIGVAEGQLNEKFKSQQQAKLMYAAAGDKDVSKKTGVSQKVAKEFIKKSHGQKVSKLPKKVKKEG